MSITLERTRPGAKQGQIILAVDLTVAGNTDEVLATIEAMGYNPSIKHVSFASGIHVLAFLKDEQHKSVPDDEYLIDEWLQVRNRINPEAVHLWRGN